jgi:hypothetical protein
MARGHRASADGRLLLHASVPLRSHADRSPVAVAAGSVPVVRDAARRLTQATGTDVVRVRMRQRSGRDVQAGCPRRPLDAGRHSDREPVDAGKTAYRAMALVSGAAGRRRVRLGRAAADRPFLAARCAPDCVLDDVFVPASCARRTSARPAMASCERRPLVRHAPPRRPPFPPARAETTIRRQAIHPHMAALRMDGSRLGRDCRAEFHGVALLFPAARCALRTARRWRSR